MTVRNRLTAALLAFVSITCADGCATVRSGDHDRRSATPDGVVRGVVPDVRRERLAHLERMSQFRIAGDGGMCSGAIDVTVLPSGSATLRFPERPPSRIPEGPSSGIYHGHLDWKRVVRALRTRRASLWATAYGSNGVLDGCGERIFFWFGNISEVTDVALTAAAPVEVADAVHEVYRLVGAATWSPKLRDWDVHRLLGKRSVRRGPEHRFGSLARPVLSE